MRTGRVAKMLLVGIMVAWMLLLPGLAPSAGTIEEGPGIESATYQAVYFYTSDTATAASYEAALSEEDFDVTVLQIGDYYSYTVYLPLVMRSASGAASMQRQATSPVASDDAVPDLSTYDLILVGPDTGVGGSWQGGSALAAAISETTRPVVALGAGGHAFLGQLDLAIGHPYGSQVMAQSAQVGDAVALTLVWEGTYPVPRAEDVAQLYDADVSTMVIPLPEKLPDGMRVASLPGESGQFPIVIEAERFILWGFGGSADDLTTAGHNLLLNLIHFGETDVKVALASRAFTPPPGVEETFADALDGAEEPLHALAQLRRPINPADREMLEGMGVTLISYLGGLNYLGLVDPTADLEDPELLALARWIGEYRPTDKVAPEVSESAMPMDDLGAEEMVALTVMFFPEVSEEDALNVLEAHGAEILNPMPLNAWAVEVDESQIVPLSEQESVRWIDLGPPPFRPFNDVARAELFVEPLQNADVSGAAAVYHGLSGSGVTWAVMDSGIDPDHDDFAGRLIRTSGSGGHGTHVGGIVGASGVGSAADGGTAFQWRGMAPEVLLASFGHANANTGDYKEAYVDYGARGSNHSYQTNSAWGEYDASAATIESIIRGDASHGGTAIPARTYVVAAANQGVAAQYDNEEGYFSVYNLSKNQICVGSLNPGSNYALRQSSSRGPTFDQRIKPDVMANGWMVSTEAGTDGYVGKGGTSMASPAVSGIVALMLEQFDRSYLTTTDPPNSTSKALLVHTATDLVHHPGQPGFTEYGWDDPDTGEPVIFHEGPDYATGYGVVNAQEAVQAVRHKKAIERTFDPGDAPHDYTISVLSGRDQIKCTLAWDDEPGDSAAAETTAKLVNDLDLRLIDPDGDEHFPWVLDPLPHTATPGDGALDPITRSVHIQPAYRGADHLNNVEVVLVDDPADIMVGDWTARVSATALPNGNSQPYSLVCDFRQINIVGGQTLVSSGFPVNAGSTGNPDKVLLRVEIENPLVTPSFTENYTTTDFLVEVGEPGDWETADVLSVFQVGGEVAIDVRPPTGMDAGVYHDVRVTLVGVDDDTQTNALYFIEADEVAGYFLTDTSGSMDGGKIEAAREAGKALVDLLRVDDWVGVGHFGTTDHHLMDVTQVVDDTQLSTARGHIHGLSAGGATAMGPGMDLAREKLNDAELPGDTQKIVFLLSDGMENTSEPVAASPPTVGCWDNHPDWDCEDNPPYVNDSWPADIQAYVVCLGEAGAAWHTFCDQVATDTGGPPVWHVYETPEGASTTTSSAASELEQSGPANSQRSEAAPASAAQLLSPSAISASHFDHPTTLVVRLDDAYLDMGQKSHRWPRMLEWTGWISPELEYVDVPIPVEEHVPVIYITLEWDEAAAALNGQLERPDGAPVDPSDPDVLYYRRDDTHIHWGIKEPKADEWVLRVIARKGLAEYIVTASGPSDIEMRLLVDPDDRFVYEEIKVCALLTDKAPIPANSPAAVAFNVIDPAGVAHWDWLFDDGNHDDGGANDGVYCGRYFDVERAGVYQVKAIGAGTTNDGRTFVRRATGHTYRRPKVLYVYKDKDIAGQYRDLFKMNGIQADMVEVGELSPRSHDLGQYALIVIGPGTGDGSDWGTADALEAMINQQRPTLGLGEGGYAFYGKLGLDIGNPYGWHGDKRDVWAVDMAHDIWQLPHDLKLSKAEVNLYKETDHVGIHIGEEAPWGVELLGREVDDREHYPIVRQVTWQWKDAPWNHCLWGYGAGPSRMTAQGRRLFFNVAWYMME